MALVTLQTIFQDAFPAYEQTHALPAHVHRAARAIMPCRTAALGGHIQACVKPKITRPVPMLGILMQLPPGIDGCIALQMHMVSAHPELRGVVRDCTPLVRLSSSTS
jgi:transposase-like zinc-binding protein